MIGKPLILSVVMGMAALSGISARAETPVVARQDTSRVFSPATSSRVLLAQDGRLDLYYDQYGRRVLVDPDTGRVVTVLPGRRDDDRYGGPRRGWQDGYDRDSYDNGYGDDRAYSDQGDGDYDYERRRRMLERRDAIIRQRELQQQRAIDSDRRTTVPQAGSVPPAPPAIPARPAERQADLGPLQPSQQQPERPQISQPQATVPTGTPFVEGAPALGPIASSAAIAQVQVLLDRAGASPGVIDGRFGENMRKALAAYTEITGKALPLDDPQAIKQQLDKTGGPAFTTYTITNKDAAGPYVASIPTDYGQKAKLDRLGYSSTAEMLAERFHMDEDYMKRLNPGANFNRPGTVIKVVDPGKPVTTKVSRIVADKSKEEVFAYDANGKLVAAYPSTIGSTDTPSPSGTVKVEHVVFNPTYTYNPKINFKQGHNDHVLTIPPGPNNPVGDVWIALSKPTYGIHGTPEPSLIGKTNSHGCVRLTNWDAEELAKLVSPGDWVQFIH